MQTGGSPGVEGNADTWHLSVTQWCGAVYADEWVTWIEGNAGKQSAWRSPGSDAVWFRARTKVHLDQEVAATALVTWV